MNLPNRLTVARFFLTLLFVVMMNVTLPFAKTVALVVFVLAGITDYIDGEIARRYSLVTDFGKLMDPLVDKIMMAAAFICLIPLGAVPAWAVVVMISREFLITGLRLLSLTKGVVLPAESLGKHKTIWQLVTVLFFLLFLSMEELLADSGAQLPDWLQLPRSVGGGALIALAVGLTLYSGFSYLWRNRDLITTDHP